MEKNKVVTHNMVALAKKKKGKGKGMRSKMLRMIMPMLSKENGDELASAIDKQDSAKFRKVWDSIREQVTDKLQSESSVITDESEIVKEDEVPEGVGKMSSDDIYKELTMLFADKMDSNKQIQKHNMNDVSDGNVVTAASKDYSRLIMGNGQIVRNTRQLVTNGKVTLISPKNVSYDLIVENISTQNNPSGDIKMKVTAGLYEEGKRKKVEKFVENDVYAAAISEIVVDAMSYVEEE